MIYQKIVIIVPFCFQCLNEHVCQIRIKHTFMNKMTHAAHTLIPPHHTHTQSKLNTFFIQLPWNWYSVPALKTISFLGHICTKIIIDNSREKTAIKTYTIDLVWAVHYDSIISQWSYRYPIMSTHLHYFWSKLCLYYADMGQMWVHV